MLHQIHRMLAGLIILTAVPAVPALAAPTTRPGKSLSEQATVALFKRAKAAIVVDCPASSTLNYPDHPPYGAEWDRMAADAHEKNAEARRIVHELRGVSKIDLPSFHPQAPGELSLNIARELANQVGDEALYLHLHGDDAGAFEAIRDVYHLADLFRGEQSGDGMVRMLVGVGCDALASARLMIIASGLHLQAGEGLKPVDVRNVRAMIGQLLDYRPATSQMTDALAAETQFWSMPLGDLVVAWQMTQPSRTRAFEAIHRVNAERVFAVMSLACHGYRHDKGQWPQTLQDLVPAYLPHVPIDPWGDGKQTFGYVLVEGGLPDGSDRPLVYDRCMATGKLFYRTDAPHYVQYAGDGSDQPLADQPNGGQFRDVASWVPKAPEENMGTIEYLKINR